jgi:hypothetical protein
MNTNSKRKSDWVMFSVPDSQTIAQCRGTFSPGIQYCSSHIEVLYPLKVLTFLFCFKLSVKSALWIHDTGVYNFKLSLFITCTERVYKRKL